MVEASSGLAPISFSFKYNGFSFKARGVRGVDGEPVLQLQSVLGTLPYSADGKELREAAMSVIYATVGMHPMRFAVGSGQRVLLAGEWAMTRPVNSQKMIAAATRLVADVKPFLDVMRLVLPSETFSKIRRNAAIEYASTATADD